MARHARTEGRRPSGKVMAVALAAWRSWPPARCSSSSRRRRPRPTRQHLSALSHPGRPRQRRRPSLRRPTTTTRPAGPGFNAGQVTAVGDSVMLDYQDPLKTAIPGINVDAAVSRQWSDGEGILQSLKSGGQLGGDVIVGLGTNGPITDSDFDSMMTILSGASRVVFVNVHVDRPWQDPNNAVLASGATRYPNAVVADWAHRWPPRIPGGSARTALTSPLTARGPMRSRSWWPRHCRTDERAGPIWRGPGGGWCSLKRPSTRTSWGYSSVG